MNRRQFLTITSTATLSAFGLSSCRFMPTEGLMNPCLSHPIPESLGNHELIAKAWEGIRAENLWDCHVHIIGTGDSNSGIWLTDSMQSLWHPIQYLQFKFYLNGSCAKTQPGNSVDKTVVDRLVELRDGMSMQSKLMLLAFDYFHDDNGMRIPDNSVFYVPNEYAYKITQQHSQRFEWIASIHPYREDAVDALKQAIQQGAKAVKWLPPAMGIDPESPKCDRFYEVLKEHDIPLLSHAGVEHAMEVKGSPELSNPLALRRALDHGVRVIVAHCASIGENSDWDNGNKPVSSFELFGRLMDDPKYDGKILGDISAIMQVNRSPEVIRQIVTRTDWHTRLIYGSDYPLPGVMPVFSTQNFVDWGYLSQPEAQVLVKIRQYNPLLYAFLLNRLMRIDGKSLGNAVFESRRFFAG